MATEADSKPRYSWDKLMAIVLLAALIVLVAETTISNRIPYRAR